MDLTSSLRHRRDFVSELTLHIRTTEEQWMARNGYDSTSGDIKTHEDYHEPERYMKEHWNKLQTSEPQANPELLQVTAEFFLCLFQEILPYESLQKTGKTGTADCNSSSPSGSRVDLIISPMGVIWYLSERHRAGLLRDGQVYLITVSYKACMEEARMLIRAGVDGGELIIAVGLALGLVYCFAAKDFRSERLETLIKRYLQDDGPVNLSIVGTIRTKSLRRMWSKAHYVKSAGPGDFQYAYDDLVPYYDDEVLQALRGLPLRQQKKQYLEELVGMPCFNLRAHGSLRVNGRYREPKQVGAILKLKGQFKSVHVSELSPNT
ncbi:hypothetical protein BJ508DRAFT_21386 [Ascobolus immersus RN42]|uniref:Uncharacterized protein n=1 Tax=Ascobolus immersus RN42 TaxID=1160509 RepID=A0A3N4HNJ7_ASCIM|nr:hypothetical protein BJ508DRAFT_21386 [Ascobolus immersus RN42]